MERPADHKADWDWRLCFSSCPIDVDFQEQQLPGIMRKSPEMSRLSRAKYLQDLGYLDGGHKGKKLVVADSR